MHFQMEDDPENPLHLNAGDVILVDGDTVTKISTQSKVRFIRLGTVTYS